MEEHFKEQVAAFRYGLIAPIVSRQTPLAPGEIKAVLSDIATREYEIPGSQRGTVSFRTLERYLSKYRKYGWEGLKPSPREIKENFRMPVATLQKAMELRREKPERSIGQIIFMLEEGDIALRGEIAPSTLSRHFKKAGLSREELLKDTSGSKGYRRFEAEDINILWQSDFQHTLYIPDSYNPGKKKKAMLFAIIDDFSRFLVHFEFYFDERLPRLEDSFKKAILKHGVPEQLYVDNGAVFSSTHLAKICAKLGVRLSHSRPYRPAGRGKIERLFRFIDTSFKPEAYVQIEAGKITTLTELNKALASWVDGYYHLRIHGSTGQTPRERMYGSKRIPVRKTIDQLTEIFLWEDERKADKAGCVQLTGNSYEIDLELAGRKVLLRYDPFDLSLIQVWYENRRYHDAVPVDLTMYRHRKVKGIKEETPLSSKTSGMDFLKLAEGKRRENWAKEPVSYAGDKKSE